MERRADELTVNPVSLGAYWQTGAQVSHPHGDGPVTWRKHRHLIGMCAEIAMGAAKMYFKAIDPHRQACSLMLQYAEGHDLHEDDLNKLLPRVQHHIAPDLDDPSSEASFSVEHTILAALFTKY